MRALLEDMKSGRVATHEVPAPELQEGGILVRTAFSAISAGTEKATVEAGRKSLLGKAMARPDLVKQVLEYAQSNGLKAARQKVQARLETLSTLGYSCSGFVLEVGAGVNGFQPGDRVACAGSGYASHCEINFVPANLAVRVPDNVEPGGCVPDDDRGHRGAGRTPGERHLRRDSGRDWRGSGRRFGHSGLARRRLPGGRDRSFQRPRCESGILWARISGCAPPIQDWKVRLRPSRATEWMRR